MFNGIKVRGIRPSQSDKISHFLIRLLKSELRHRAKKERLNYEGTKSCKMVKILTKSIKNCLLTIRTIKNIWIDISELFYLLMLPSIQL